MANRVPQRYIAIEGVIGAGKTTLVNLLASQLDARVVLDETDNPFLEGFYRDRPGAAFQAQLFFLLSRHRQQLDLNQVDLFQQLVVCDYLFEKDKVFAYLNLEDSELALYEKIYSMLAVNLPAPDLVVYLQASNDTLMERIELRSREYETDIAMDYIRELNEAYEHFFYHFTDTPLLVVKTDGVDFIEDRDRLVDLIHQIGSIENGKRYYVPLRS